MQVGQMVMVRDPYIGDKPYRIPPARILRVDRCSILLRNNFLLLFENGVEEWFDQWCLKTE
jgi:hypothetical protein